MTAAYADVPGLIESAAAGDAAGASRLSTLLYDDLRAVASRLLRGEARGHSLQPTDLVNEAFLRLVRQESVSWRGRTHFLAIGAQVMRRILVDHARARLREKRGGSRRRIALSDDAAVTLERPDEVLALDEAIARLGALDPGHARLAESRLFGGLESAEVASVLGVSPRTVERRWAFVLAWLKRSLAEPAEDDPPGEPPPS